MSSHSRNNRQPIQALKVAVAATLLAGSAVRAAEQPSTFELTAFSNVAAGTELAAGNYSSAVQQIDSHARALDSDSLNTNRCVAYVVTRQLQAAHVACDAAVRDAQQAIATLPMSLSYARSEYRSYLALAYSNRAVLNWLSNDSAAAQADLKKAKAVAPKARFVARNLNALQSRSTVAQVAGAPKS